MEDQKKKFKEQADVDPLELVGHAHLALHHHMAPADGAFDLETAEISNDDQE